MYKIKTSASFDSAHFLAGYEGKCSNIHGHHWVVEASFSGPELIQDGTQRDMLIDFSDIKKEVRGIAKSFDHALICEVNSLKPATMQALKDENFCIIEVPFRPTAENFSRYFFQLLNEKSLPVCSVSVYETPKNCATYEVD